MAQFCGNCGNAREQARFCTACGQPFEDVTTSPTATGTSPAQAPPSAHAGPPPQAGFPPPSSPGQWAPTAASPSTPAINPFAGVPISDYVRDVVALVFLFSTLGVIWDFQGDGSDHWWVVISVLLSAASLAIPYVLASRVIPGWNHQHALFAKVALNAPLAVSVFAAALNAVINLNSDSAGGLGHGVAFAVLGLMLAIQPRKNDDSPTLAYDPTWRILSKFSVVAVAVALALYAVRLVVDAIGDGVYFDELLLLVTEVITSPLMLLLVLGLPAVLSLNGSVWRRVFAAGAFGLLTASLFSHAGDDSFILSIGVERWDTPTTGLFLIAFAAATSISHAAQRQTAARVEPVRGWLDTAQSALLVSAIALALTALAPLLVSIHDDFEVSRIIVSVLLLATAALAGITSMLVPQVATKRPLALGLTGAVVFMGIVVAALANAQDVPTGLFLYDGYFFALTLPVFGFTALACAAFFALPGLALYALVAPPEVRTALGPLFPQPATPAPGPGQQPEQQQWAPPPTPDQSEPGTGQQQPPQ